MVGRSRMTIDLRVPMMSGMTREGGVYSENMEGGAARDVYLASPDLGKSSRSGLPACPHTPGHAFAL